MKVGLIIGHKANKPGACNHKHGMCEFQFNLELAGHILDHFHKIDSEIDPVIIKRTTYKNLPEDVNAINPAFAISMHCNAINGQFNFTETLYYHKSKRGKKLAEIVQSNMVKALGFRDRGIKGRGTEDRGGYLLRYTKMPVVIAEPFFIDNDQAFEEVYNTKKYDALIEAYAQSIIDMVEY